MEAVPFYGRVKLVDLTDQSQTVAKGVSESSLEYRVSPSLASRVSQPFLDPVTDAATKTAVITTGLRNETLVLEICHYSNATSSYEPPVTRRSPRRHIFTTNEPDRSVR